MRKIKTFLCIALFGAMSIGAYSAYDYITMSVAEKAILENIEALTSGEGGTGASETCYRSTQYHPTQRTPICIGNGLCRYQDKCMYVLGTNGESCTITL